MFTTGGSAICCISPGRQRIQEGGIQRLYQKVQLQDSSASRGGPRGQGLPGVGIDRGACRDAHFLRRTGGAGGDAGLRIAFYMSDDHRSSADHFADHQDAHGDAHAF